MYSNNVVDKTNEIDLDYWPTTHRRGEVPESRKSIIAHREANSVEQEESP